MDGLPRSIGTTATAKPRKATPLCRTAWRGHETVGFNRTLFSSSEQRTIGRSFQSASQKNRPRIWRNARSTEIHDAHPSRCLFNFQYIKRTRPFQLEKNGAGWIVRRTGWRLFTLFGRSPLACPPLWKNGLWQRTITGYLQPSFSRKARSSLPRSSRKNHCLPHYWTPTSLWWLLCLARCR